MSPRLKMGLVGALSCLTLLLGLLSTTGIASAHTTSALQNQVSTSAVAKDNRNRHCQTFIIVRNRFSREEDQNFFMQGSSFQQGSMFGQGHFVHRRFFRNFETIVIVTICHGHRSERFQTISI